MAVPFSNSLRSLDAERGTRWLTRTVPATLVLVAWGAWFLFARVPVRVVSSTARIEVSSAAHPVAAQVTGRVVSNHIALGRGVEIGDLLLELDAESEVRQLEEAEGKLRAIGPQSAALEHQISAEEQARQSADRERAAEVAESRAKYDEAEANAAFAGEDARRRAALFAQSLATGLDLLRANANEKRARASAESMRIGIDRLEWSRHTQSDDRAAHIEELRQKLELLRGDGQAAKAATLRLQHEIEKRRIRAAIQGRLGEVEMLPPGTVVHEGQRIAAIVPAGPLRIVADFDPSLALGRVQSGQPALMHLDGYPSAQYGAVRASVSTVANEVRANRVRVELELHMDPTSPLPMLHSLPGTVSIEVERVSPAILVLRWAGAPLYRGAPAEESSRLVAGSRP